MNTYSIDRILKELDIAVKDHYDCLFGILKFCILDESQDKKLIDEDEHHHCCFSHWLRQNANNTALCSMFFATIKQAHEIKHRTTRQLLHAIQDGSVDIDKIKAYLDAQRLFITHIDSYRSDLIAYRNQLDTLTGLPLRQCLYKDFEQRMVRRKRNHHSVYLLMLDIDRFKSINDTYGHNTGDEVLKVVAHRLLGGIRNSDTLYRFGGEEFVILFDASSHTTVAEIAGRLCQLLPHTPIVISDKTRLTVTVTGGLTQAYADEQLFNVIERADKAMYQGKKMGETGSP